MNDYIQVLDDMLTEKECQLIIDFFESSDHEPGKVWAGDGLTETKVVNKDMKDLDQIYVPFESDIDKILEHSMSQIVKFYSDTYTFYPRTGTLDKGYNLKRYLANAEHHYNWHTDTSMKSTSDALVSVIWYLNDVEEGGETEFEHRKIVPKAGRVVTFPSIWTHPHRSLPCMSGPKYVACGHLFFER